MIDYTKEENPCLAWYGDEWRQEVEQSTFVKGFVCITKMISKKLEESSKGPHMKKIASFIMMLSLIDDCKETREWMKERKYEKMWILPEKWSSLR